MSTTVIDPHTTAHTIPGQPDRVVADAIKVRDLKRGDIITNLGKVEGVEHIGVFVIAAVKGTVWSLSTGTGDVYTQNVVWHESNFVSVDFQE